MQIDFNKVTPMSILISSELKKELRILKDNRFNDTSNSQFFEMLLTAGLKNIKNACGESGKITTCTK